jgi:steroid delta-isomerase-like uncharacterized protein
MSRQDIVALFDRRSAAWTAKDAHALAALHAEHGTVASPTGGALEGRQEIERIYQVWLSAFPDIQVKVEDLIIDGNRAVELSHLTGTHAGEFFGVSPTGRRVAVATASVVTIEDGEIAHERRIFDFTGVLVQVGVLKAKPV